MAGVEVFLNNTNLNNIVSLFNSSKGLFLLTGPVLGSSIKSKQSMINKCKNTFGSSFTAANHQMGRYMQGMSSSSYFYNSWPNSGTLSGGWGARGYGNLPSIVDSGFILVIKQQTVGTLKLWN